MDSLLAVFLGFGAFLLLAHIPIIRVRLARPDKTPADVTGWKRWWEKSDYLTVGLAALALIPAAAEMSRAVESIEQRRALDGGSEQVMKEVIDGEVGKVARRRVPDDWSEDERRTARKYWDRMLVEQAGAWTDCHVGRWCYSRGDRYGTVKCLGEAREKFQSLLAACEGGYGEKGKDADGVRRMADAIRRALKEVDVLEMERATPERGGVEDLLRMLNPWLLSMALAIRLAKVSSKILVRGV